ncbi:Hypothetical protein CINCED_3A020784 [Cinara cedri]|uniref:BCL2-associated athanogene 6 n=1 Tax=Cinara cedri TaxID=506608 RepID=A0A5E4NQV9_9HEMI|nr:Hypothetical protein CINCED_3A020784 [Cinara cedri]
MIDLTIKTLDSQNHTFSVPDAFTILELKEHIADKVNVPVIQQRLIFCGRVLSNETKLADIGIHGKVMHLVQKAPRLTTTTSGSSSSTTTNTNSRPGQNNGHGFRGWHAYDPTVLFSAIGIPSEIINPGTGESPRIINPRNTQMYNRISFALDMVRKAHEILNRLETIQSNEPTSTDGEQEPEGSQEAEATLGSVPPELSTPPTQTADPEVNVSYEVDDTFPNTVVVTIDATHHMRMSPGLMRHMQNHLHEATNLQSPPGSSTDQTVERETTAVPETTSAGPTNQSSTEQTTSSNRPSSTVNDQSTRSGPTIASERRRLRDIIEQLNKLNARLQPFFALYTKYLTEEPQVESTRSERGSPNAQVVFNCVSEVLHYISHINHLLSDLRMTFSRQPNRNMHPRQYLMQGTILHTAHSFTSTTTATPPSTQQPTSTQTTNTSQSIPSVRAFRLDFMNPEGIGSEIPNVSTSATSTETNANVTVDPNTEITNSSSEFSTDNSNALAELVFDMTPGTIHIDTVEAAFINSNSSGSIPPTGVPQSSSSIETSNNSMPIDWVDQMIDVISSGVRRPLMSDQSLDWAGIPTTSTQTPRVTPRTANSSSTTNSPPSQGYGYRPTITSIPRGDPYLPCHSHHFEPNLRPVVLARRTQGNERILSTPFNNANLANETSLPTVSEMRPSSLRRTARPRTRYVHDIDGFMSGIHPILNFGRNNRFNTTAASPASNNTQPTLLTRGTMEDMSAIDMTNIFERLEREGFDRVREFPRPLRGSTLGLETTIISVPQSTARQPNELLLTPIGNIPFFSGLEGSSVLVDLFLLIARDWTLHDLINLNTVDLESSIVQNPVSRHSGALVNFFLDRIMRNQPHTNHNIEEAANRIFLEMVSYIHVFQCSVPTRTNVDLNESFRRCIVHNLRLIAVYCDENRGTATINILPPLILFAEALMSLVVYCCNNNTVFRLCVGALMQFLPLPTHLHQIIMDEVRLNVDLYWDTMANNLQIGFPVVDFIVPFDSNEFDAAQTSRVGNAERSNSTLPSQEIVNEPLPEVVIGSQEWHHSVPSEWVPVITRDTQRQRRQGPQPPYSDAYLSGMPNKRRKIVTNSKPQGPLSQIIAKNLEVAMGAAGVTINKEVTATVGADAAVQNAYTERIKTLGRSGLDTHPDFSPDRYPNASKFFYDRNRPN